MPLAESGASVRGGDITDRNNWINREVNKCISHHFSSVTIAAVMTFGGKYVHNVCDAAELAA